MQKLIIAVFLLISLDSLSQTTPNPVMPGTFNTGGGTAQLSPSFTMDWSIGESTVIDTWYGENAEATAKVGLKWNVTSGVLQPFDKNQKISDLNNQFWTTNEVVLFPVPTHDVINIDFRSTTTGKISVRLLSIDGKEIAAKQFNHENEGGIHSFNLKNRASGTYFFSITLTSASGQQLKQGVFKFEKLN